MAPLPENNTARFWLDYTDGQNPHSLLVRYDQTQMPPSDVAEYVEAFFNALSPILYLVGVSGARYSSQGSNISLPFSWTGAATFGQFAMPAELAPRQLCFLGRDAVGRRSRWFVYGWEAAPPNPFRLELNNPAELGAAWQVISDAQLAGAFISISGLNPTMYGYVDVNYNSYYEAKMRA